MIVQNRLLGFTSVVVGSTGLLVASIGLLLERRKMRNGPEQKPSVVESK